MRDQYPNVANQLEWKTPDVDGLVDFLVKDKGFKYAPLLSGGYVLIVYSDLI